MTNQSTDMFGLSVDEAIQRYEGVQKLIHETLISLLTAFDEETCSFYRSLHEKRLSNPSFRDTAAVLTAIESAALPIMDKQIMPGATFDRLKYLEEAFEQLGAGKPEPLSYKSYQNIFFRPCVGKISDGEPDEILGKPAGDKSWEPWSHRDVFTCSRILRLLHRFNNKDTHKKVYVEALCEVATALARSYGPHYTFGGAAITGDPHGFVSYYALRALRGLFGILNRRAEQHERFSTLLQEIVEWQGDNNSDARLELETSADFKVSLRSRLESFSDSVGLEDMTEATRKHCEPQGALDPAKLSADVLEAVTGHVLPWVSDFLGLAETKRSETEAALKQQHKAIPKRWKEGKLPGEGLTLSVQDYQNCAGLAWVVALFEGTCDVLSKIQGEYGKLGPSSDLSAIAACVKNVGDHWHESGRITELYVAAFAKWAAAEVRKQLSAWDLSSRRDFDAGQLAFGIRILHDLAPREYGEMIRRGLDVLAEDQAQDGTWRAGAPFAFIPESLAAIYAANIEIASALVPVVEEHGDLRRYGGLLERVYLWLETSRQWIWPMGMHRRISGWATDRVRERGRIDVWMGAIALEFLGAYRGLLENHARATILDGHYNRQSTAQLPQWARVVDSELEKNLAERTTKKIFDDFIKPFKERGANRKTGLILYGPPGTAKTTVTGAIASELGWDLVTITPSDFVKEGIERSEDAARRIFADLLRLRHVVVLFDEIDEMLRSRHEQGEKPTGVAMLQFLVPGMLPKLQQLKQYGESTGLIFVIATNFKERLDPAIVRPGRIDDVYLIPPPDYRTRQFLFRKMMGKRVDPSKQADRFKALCAQLADWTGGWVYKEIETLADRVARDHLESNPRGFYKEFGKRQRQRAACLAAKPVGSQPWEGWSVKGLQRALKLEEQYRSRLKAEDELKAVLSVCWPRAEQTQMIEAIRTILGQ